MTAATAMKNQQVLVIDDEPDLCTLYELTLLREGYQVTTAGTVALARDLLLSRRFDLVITDMRLPDGVGTDLLKDLKAQQRPERCIVITAYGSAENAVESLKAGAFDYLTKPVDLKQFRDVVAAATRGAPATPKVGQGQQSQMSMPLRASRIPNAEESLLRLVGNSASIRAVRDRVAKVARSMAPVLVQGESGTGKELVALALHANSHRAEGPWVAVNCGAIPENLLEVEFFGAKKGAYTGSSQDREGFFKAASGGTLFLDEIGDLPMAMQAKLLRAIQERCIRPIGTNQEEPVDVRIVSATHKNLPNEVAAGRFRQDLFYRLNVIDIAIAPLRERSEDLPLLCEALLKRIALESGSETHHISEQAIEQLRHLPLLGNVRELENLLHRAVALCDGGDLQMDIPACHPRGSDVPIRSAPDESLESLPLPADLQAHLDQKEKEILVRTLKETGFNRTLAAQKLGLSLRQIRYRITRLKIDVPLAHEDDSES